MNNELPLASICITNYNYGHHLEQCLDSVLKQTYPNLEVSFSDNASTDNSVEIAYKFRKRFLKKGVYFHLNQNKRTLSNDRDSASALNRTEGGFIYTLTSDNMIAPTFIESCMSVFLEYPRVGTVITHRDEMDESGKNYQTPPFYNTSCVVNGESQAAVCMMTGITVPGQRMIRRSILKKTDPFVRKFTIAKEWFYDFLYTMGGDIAYIAEPLFKYRLHSQNETNEAEEHLHGAFEHFQLIKTFVDISKAFKMEKPAARYDEAIKKLGEMCLRYALKMFKARLDDMAIRYLKQASVFAPEIENDDIYKKLLRCVKASKQERAKIIASLKKSGVVSRAVSYDPPEGFVPITNFQFSEK
jgi:glycosyltransferase involved in cell wall biosynthesis